MNKIQAITLIIGMSLGSFSYAQYLSIGGVELRLGQSENDVRTSLEKIYIISNMNPSGSGRRHVIKKNENKIEFLGSIYIKDGVLVGIERDYDESSVNFSKMFHDALSEIKTRSNQECTYTDIPIAADNRKIESDYDFAFGFSQQIRLECGLYKLILDLPTIARSKSNEQKTKLSLNLFVGYESTQYLNVIEIN